MQSDKKRDVSNTQTLPVGKPLNRIHLNTILIATSVATLILAGNILLCTFDLYQQTDGKGRALFGMIEGLTFGWKYWLLIPAILSLVTGILQVKHGEKTVLLVTVFLNILSIIIIVAPVWRLFRVY